MRVFTYIVALLETLPCSTTILCPRDVYTISSVVLVQQQEVSFIMISFVCNVMPTMTHIDYNYLDDSLEKKKLIGLPMHIIMMHL